MPNMKTPEENKLAAIQIAADLHSQPELKEKVLRDPHKALTELYDISPDLAKEIIKEDPTLRDRVSADWCICTGCCITSKGLNLEDSRINPAIRDNMIQDELLSNLIKGGHLKSPKFRKYN